MAVQVTRQTGYALQISPRLNVSRQTAYALQVTPRLNVSRQTAYALLLHDGSVTSKIEVAAWLDPSSGSVTSKLESGAWLEARNGTSASKVEIGAWLDLADCRMAKIEIGAWLDKEAPVVPSGYRGIRRGSQTIANVLKSTSSLSRVYKGAQLVYRKGSTVVAVTSTRWRIRYVSMFESGQAQVRDIRMKQSAGGPDLCVGGTPISSTAFNADFAAAKAFDHQGNGNSSSKWSSNGFQNQEWVGYQFANPVEVNVIEMWCGNAPSDMIREGVVEYWNGTDWVFRRFISQPAWAIDEMRQIDASAFTPPVPGTPSSTRYRIQLVNSDSGYFGFSQIEMRATLGGVDQIGPGIPRSSSDFSQDFRAHMAVDRRTGSLWHSAGASDNDWWEYEWPYPVTVQQLVIRARDSENGVAPRDFVFQRWNGTTFVAQKTITGLASWTTGETRTFDVR
jgi:hypothetical protein